MQFAPIEESTLDECLACGDTFEHINEEAIENLCPKCQAAMRIAAAKRMHETGRFRDYRMENFLRNPAFRTSWLG